MTDEMWFGLLIWSVQRQKVDAEEKRELLHKLEAAERAAEELKRRRGEDARANEKVVSIFASREQGWLSERKTMRQHIGALINELRILERRKHEEISELNERLRDMEVVVKSKNDVLEEERRLKRDLEAQVEFVLEQREESMLMLQSLSIELEKARKDSEQKSNILSALLRKSKLDTEEKRRLLKEVVNLSKDKMKEAEPERWTESKSERQSLTSLLTKQVRSRFGVKTRTNRNLVVLETENGQREEAAITTECLTKKDGSLWKIDIHGIGVSYKIKRIKQLLVMVERLAGNQADGDSTESEDQCQMRMKGFLMLLSLLNKQADRYQTLQEKADALRKLMDKKILDVNHGEPETIPRKEDSVTPEHSLEETFQLQRLIVASGQKLMEVQSKFGCGFSDVVAEKVEGCTNTFDMRRVSDNIWCLFREVQRGLEVRVARMIGEYLEGTLVWDGIRFRQE